MTPQEIFDKVATHLFTQGTRAYFEGNTVCMYRTPDGKKCAVGCLIPDIYYTYSMEFIGVSKLIKSGLLPDIGIDWKSNMSLLSALQRVHDSDDNWESSESMNEALEFAALDYDLDQSVLKGLQFSDR